MMQRRDVLKTFVGTGVSLAMPGMVLHQQRKVAPSTDPTYAETLRDPRVKQLATRALEAAQAAGAHYADVRLTNTIRILFGAGAPQQRVDLGFSVRALVNGYWGWSATPMLSLSEAVRVGQLAVALAKQNASHGKARTVDLGTVPAVRNGEWATPVKVDPFHLRVEEVADWMRGLNSTITGLSNLRGAERITTGIGAGEGAVNINFYKQERLFASTDGSMLTQTVIITDPNFGFKYRGIPAFIPGFQSPVQAGWEYISEASLQDGIRQSLDHIDETLAHPLPVHPVQIGRYDIVLTASVMATFLSETLGPACELDRALGYEANADGTSYLGPDPLRFLGTSVASPLITVTADRSAPLGLATVRWDDEGVAPTDFPLVQDGVLVDYLTTREQATWLRSWYERQGQPVHSHGCMMAPSALDMPLQHLPNLALHPGSSNHDVDELVSGVSHGLLFDAVKLDVDFQCNSGVATPGTAIEIRNGKRVAQINGAGLLFRSSEFWKKVQALGGPSSVQRIGGFGSQKGEPEQVTPYTIAAAPAYVKEQAIIDIRQTG